MPENEISLTEYVDLLRKAERPQQTGWTSAEIAAELKCGGHKARKFIADAIAAGQFVYRGERMVIRIHGQRGWVPVYGPVRLPVEPKPEPKPEPAPAAKPKRKRKPR
jgi:hypothetical protein